MSSFPIQSFGWVKKDLSLSSFTSQQALFNTLQAIIARISNAKQVIPIPYSNSTPTLSIAINTPAAQYVLFMLDHTVNVSATWNISVSSSANSTIGDKIAFVFNTGPSGHMTMNYSSDHFFLTRCGGSITSETFPNDYRVIRSFTFDGVKWVNSDDNC